ncbi:MAG: aminopeptidase [Bacteroidetes bacterium]|nr:aminopeptidase [Bacteroidota bacterium]
MKKILPFLLIVLAFVSCTSKQVTLENLQAELQKLDGVVSVEAVAYDTLALPYVKAKYVVMIEQALDHNNANSPKFTQRFTLLHSSFDKPMIFVTEGYIGAYALRTKYASELGRHFEANETVVEHRFFAESTPDSLAWEYLRGPQAAADLHKVNQELRKIYKTKFITTGISKGGQTTMFYKTYYPEDADLSVPYVGPLCFGVEDGRHEPFLAQVGRKTQRDSIINFQREVLKRRKAMVSMLDEYSAKNNLTYRVINSNELLDYCVLELSFSLWQWGTPVSILPSLKSSDKEIFEGLVNLAGPEYFAANSPTQAFDVQALAELGYYGYDTEPFKDLLVVKSTKDYLRNIFVPIEAKETVFDGTQADAIVKYLNENDPKMIFIYGEKDPWTAPAPNDSLFAGKTNLKKYVQPNGSHRSRINNMPDSTMTEIYSILDKWLAE